MKQIIRKSGLYMKGDNGEEIDLYEVIGEPDTFIFFKDGKTFELIFKRNETGEVYEADAYEVEGGIVGQIEEA